MYGVHHFFWIWKSLRIEFVTSPFFFRPVEPVLYNIINTYFSFAEFFQRINQFILSFVSLAALPESHGPFRHDLRFSGQSSVSAYHFVHVFAVNEIIINFITHFAPNRKLVLFCFRKWAQRFQSYVGNASVGFPFHSDRNPFAGFHVVGKFIIVWIPGSSPSFFHYNLVVQINGHIAGVVEVKVVITGFIGFDFALPGHF